jgi:hypothetical protein
MFMLINNTFLLGTCSLQEAACRKLHKTIIQQNIFIQKDTAPAGEPTKIQGHTQENHQKA